MIATFIYIYPGVASGDGVWLVASSLFVSSFLYSPVFRIHARTRTPRIYSYVHVHAVYYAIYGEESGRATPDPRCLLRGARHVEAVGA